jgi:hypothetical protein
MDWASIYKKVNPGLPMSERENKCKPPNGEKMYVCSVFGSLDDQEKCKYFEKSKGRGSCIYIMKFDDFYHCGCCKAQNEAG